MLRHLISRIALGMVIIAMIGGHTAVYSVYSSDISQIGVGARPMGMGKAFVALADDSSAMFLNPAGLALQKKPQILSMQTNLLTDVNYLTFGGTTPLGPGTAGLSLLQSYVDDIALTELDANDRPQVTDRVSYFEGIWALSYGLQLNEYLRSGYQWNVDRPLYGGISLKYLHKGVSEMGTAGGGMNADVGFLYVPDDKLSYGLMFKNILPSLGVLGSVNWNTGASDPMTSYTTLGAAYRFDPKLTMLLDYDFSFMDKRKALIHFGTEYRFDSYAAVRLGWEQLHDSIGEATFSHITFGLSLNINGFSPDYAYQPYYDVEQYTSHFISFGYAFDTPQAPIFTFDQTYEEVAGPPLPAPDISVFFAGSAGPEVTELIPDRNVTNISIADLEEMTELVSEIQKDHEREQDLCSDYEAAAWSTERDMAQVIEDDSVSMMPEGMAHDAD